MKKTTTLLSLSLLSLVLAGCSQEDSSAAKPEAATEAQKPADAQSTKGSGENMMEKAEKSVEGAVDKTEKSVEGLLDSDKEPGTNAGMKKVADIAGYSSVLTQGWDSIKGLGFDQKDELLKQLKSIISKAGSNIGALKQVAPMLSGGAGSGLVDQITGLTGQLDSLKSLYDKGKGIAAGDWGSYKDQIGSAIKSLSGGFSGLSSLLK
jgi:hypothetical protein